MNKIKNALKRIVGRGTPKIDKNVILTRDKHNISRQWISPNALKVLYRLHKNGYESYLVGGGVRDLLLGREPKDFDIVTNAKPEQVRRLFKNSLMIGKRFCLVHVRFADEIIEVATFRKASFNPDVSHKSGMILRDNVYGTLQDDVWRRDFTINALYYNIADFSVVDYTQGVEDLSKGLVRIIGDASERYREDPVRILRAIRFAAKLGFKLEPATEQPIRALSELLNHISSARLFDETMKLFLSGTSTETFALLHHYDLLTVLFPGLDLLLKDSKRHLFIDQFILQLLKNTDDRINSGKTVTPAFLFAGLLWFDLQKRMQVYLAEGLREHPAYEIASREIISEQIKRIAIPKRFTAVMREIWALQFQLTKRRGRRPFRVLFLPRFKAGFDFLLLRAQVDADLMPLANWWQNFF